MRRVRAAGERRAGRRVDDVELPPAGDQLAVDQM